MKSDTKVSILVLAYNHGEYISQTLDSILMQDTDFNYEIIIGDDCSTDNTRQIILDYYGKYPLIIKPIFRKNNLGGPGNFYDILMRCKGDYIAFLEGDDFWTDKHKLNKQLEFLLNNKEYVATVHKNIIVDKQGKKVGESDSKIPSNKEVGKKELLRYSTKLAHPGTLFYKNIFKEKKDDYTIIRDSNKYGIHFTMLSLLISKGKIYMMSDYMSAWRCIISSNAKNYTSMAKKNPLDSIDNQYVMLANLRQYFGDYYDYTRIKSKLFANLLLVLLSSPKYPKRESLKKFTGYMSMKEIPYIPVYFVNLATKVLYYKFKGLFTHNLTRRVR
ncbi:glycosyltransferase family 2 protein [Neobacillus vireti]|uniref:Glycosyltransferase n=1 Tax=Neobacillus vireti LMG 21834 TaxID=1131730 RepID=A0AB94IQB2_9BACI|nr:glycosyltransferase [Neobacillus vireti]ETI69197.1 glycosyltransferase [Neobacillus vireti LMG 21834]